MPAITLDLESAKALLAVLHCMPESHRDGAFLRALRAVKLAVMDAEQSQAQADVLPFARSERKAN